MESITTTLIPKRFPSQLIDRTLAYLAETGGMMLQLELAFPDPLNAARLARVAYLALQAKPVLGYRFVDHWRKPYWERVSAVMQAR